MKIDEAISLLECDIKPTGSRDISYLAEAIKLGIEALKHIKARRIAYPTDFYRPLSGETNAKV